MCRFSFDSLVCSNFRSSPCSSPCCSLPRRIKRAAAPQIVTSSSELILNVRYSQALYTMASAVAFSAVKAPTTKVSCRSSPFASCRIHRMTLLCQCILRIDSTLSADRANDTSISIAQQFASRCSWSPGRDGPTQAIFSRTGCVCIFVRVYRLLTHQLVFAGTILRSESTSAFLPAHINIALRTPRAQLRIMSCSCIHSSNAPVRVVPQRPWGSMIRMIAVV